LVEKEVFEFLLLPVLDKKNPMLQIEERKSRLAST